MNTTAPSTPVRSAQVRYHPPSLPREERKGPLGAAAAAETATTATTRNPCWMNTNTTFATSSSLFDNIMSNETEDGWFLAAPTNTAPQEQEQHGDDISSSKLVGVTGSSPPRLQPRWHNQPNAADGSPFTPGKQGYETTAGRGSDAASTSCYSVQYVKSCSSDSESHTATMTLAPPRSFRPILIEDDSSSEDDMEHDFSTAADVYRVYSDEGDSPDVMRRDLTMLQQSWDDLEMYDENDDGVPRDVGKPRLLLLPRTPILQPMDAWNDPPPMEWMM